MVDKADPLQWMTFQNSSYPAPLTGENILDYFCHPVNPFYDRKSINEYYKMQRQEHQQKGLTGTEFAVVVSQPPVFFVIRKQQRSATSVEPRTDYYVIGGVVYQAPDLYSVVGARLMNACSFLLTAFNQAKSMVTFNPEEGYRWKFHEKAEEERQKKSGGESEEVASVFQAHRTDLLLAEWARRFPPRVPAAAQPSTPATTQPDAAGAQETPEPRQVSGERSMPPPEKRQKMANK